VIVSAAGERVQPTDFEWAYKDTSFSLDGIPQPEDMVGRRLRQALRAGDTLWLGLLEKEKAIRRLRHSSRSKLLQQYLG
jgi:hypothetical protein